jgi:hypothetical protein
VLVSLAAVAAFALIALPTLTYFTGVAGLVKYWCAPLAAPARAFLARLRSLFFALTFARAVLAPQPLQRRRAARRRTAPPSALWPRPPSPLATLRDPSPLLLVRQADAVAGLPLLDVDLHCGAPHSPTHPIQARGGVERGAGAAAAAPAAELWAGGAELLPAGGQQMCVRMGVEWSGM